MVATQCLPMNATNHSLAANTVSISFPLIGKHLPGDMGYPFYASLSQACAAIHGMEGLQIATVRCKTNQQGLVEIPRHAALELRAPVQQLPELLSLAGRQLELNQRDQQGRVRSCVVTLGIPAVQRLDQVAGGTDRLYFRHICFKIRDRQTKRLLTDADEGFWPRWSAALQKQLALRSITPSAALIDVNTQGQPFSRCIRAGAGFVTTVGLTLTGLNGESVLALLAQGLGGKQRMGCGVAVVPSRIFAS